MEPQLISEGLAKVQTAGSVFYNPVQEFNRDLSVSVISAFAKQQGPQKLTILEALSATGLRSIRYAKEIPGVGKIVANDLSSKAVEDIRRNIELNGVGDLVEACQSDACSLMHEHKQAPFDVIDLDPYGCPSIFLDSAVQAVKDGGLLLITATDMAVLAGNTPETCYSKYGAISLRMKSCHEMALRILLQCVEGHCNRYGRYLEPLLSLSADFYVRVFVRVHKGAQKCKYTLSKLSHVYHCTGCDSHVLQPLGATKTQDAHVKFCLPAAPSVGGKCEHCGGSYHMGGPIWAAPIHSSFFVKEVLASASMALGTYKRIQGVLSVIAEELQDVPLYYTLERLAGTLRVETPSMTAVRSAILNAGYRVSYTHANKTSIKTDAPARVLWDIMRCWEKLHPASKKRLELNRVAATLLEQKPLLEHSFDLHPDATPESKQKGLVRFQANPQRFWGPGSRARATQGQDKMAKSVKNQGKRKRTPEEDSDGLNVNKD